MSSSYFKTFKNDSKLLAHLSKVCPDKMNINVSSYSSETILLALKNDILTERQFDPNNPVIILCNENLERALNVRALHLSELRYYVQKHFINSSITPTPTPSPSTTQSPTPSTTQSPIPSITQSPIPSITQSPIPSTTTQSSFPSSKKSTTSPKTPNPSISLKSTEPQNSKSELTRSISDPTPLTSSSSSNKSFLFSLSSPLNDFLRNYLSEFNSKQKFFEKTEITKYLSSYILSHQSFLFDPRNINIAIVEGDPLGKLFGVKAFHRSQVSALLTSHLIMAVESPSCVSEFLFKRRHSYTQESLEISMKRPRTFSSSPEEEDESIYSAQGYETMALVTDDSSSVGSEKDFKDVYEIEYELDDEDIVDEKETDESESDHDVVIAFLHEIDNENDDKSEMTFWADSESDVDDVPINSYRLKGDKNWKCCQCGLPNTLFLNYCQSCWETRKDFCPPRPKPKTTKFVSKRKDKRTRGQGIKKSSSAVPEDSGVSSQELLPPELPDSAMSEKSRVSLCNFCLSRSKNATLIHGKIGHTCCCYQCAKKLWRTKKPCPICRRKIEKFVVNIVV